MFNKSILLTIQGYSHLVWLPCTMPKHDGPCSPLQAQFSYVSYYYLLDFINK